MAKTKIAVLWGVLIAMMVACAGIYATLKAREMNPYISGTSTRIESVQPQGEASAGNILRHCLLSLIFSPLISDWMQKTSPYTNANAQRTVGRTDRHKTVAIMSDSLPFLSITVIQGYHITTKF